MITVPAIAIKKRTNNIPNNRSITPEHQKKTSTYIHHHSLGFFDSIDVDKQSFKVTTCSIHGIFTNPHSIWGKSI